MESLVEWLEIKQRIANRDATFGVMPDRRYGQAATAITALEAELAEAKAEIERLADNGCHLEMLLAAVKARGDRLAEFAEHDSDCVLRIPKAIRSRSSVQEVCSCGKGQALTEWRDQ